MNDQTRLQCVGNYDVGKTIGQGQFGKVKLGRHVLTRELVAIKIIQKSKLDQKTLRMVYREIHIMKLLRHPHVIQLYQILETEKYLFLIMEYASGGEVLDYIVAHGRLQEKEARRFFIQIICALKYCHKNRVVHRDLKAESMARQEKKQEKKRKEKKNQVTVTNRNFLLFCRFRFATGQREKCENH
jgi:serine/threonine protein kinase